MANILGCADSASANIMAPPTSPLYDPASPTIELGEPLEMIHGWASTAIWNGLTPCSRSNAFINHNEEVYKLGGKVYRAVINGEEEEQDVMLCEQDACASCRAGRLVIVGDGRTGGFPFVHSSTLEVKSIGSGFSFKPPTKAYEEGYPRHLGKAIVRFRDGMVREVMKCEAAICEWCSGQDAITKKAARYKPGGDLHKLKNVEARKGEQESRIVLSD